MEKSYKYIVVGAGLAGASAVEGIRDIDPDGRILMLGAERHLPYHRPPLSKKLWQGKKKVEDIFIKDASFFESQGVDVLTDTPVAAVNPASKTVTGTDGRVYGFEKLLLATGGQPAVLDIPGGTADGVCYFRYLDDYLALSETASQAGSALIVGGGFIGSEMAAALCAKGLKVTMLFKDPYICGRMFPPGLGHALNEEYRKRGVEIITSDQPVSIEKTGSGFAVRTHSGRDIQAELVVVGVGLVPSVELAQQAGLETANGIAVNETLQTSHQDIFAAGDNASFPFSALGKRVRIEHWDNALNQGKLAGRNMAGAGERYDYIPYFFSDLFDFGYEAVGEVDSSLETFEDWQKPYETGVVYYLHDGRVRGVMMCNIWDRVDTARELISCGERFSPADLKGRIN